MALRHKGGVIAAVIVLRGHDLQVYEVRIIDTPCFFVAGRTPARQRQKGSHARMLLGRSGRGIRRKQTAPTPSSTGLAIPVSVNLQQGERQSRAKKRTVAEILAADASALPQPAAAKRQRKAPGAYKYLDGAEGVQKNQTPARPITAWMCSSLCHASPCSMACRQLSCLPMAATNLTSGTVDNAAIQSISR